MALLQLLLVWRWFYDPAAGTCIPYAGEVCRLQRTTLGGVLPFRAVLATEGRGIVRQGAPQQSRNVESVFVRNVKIES